MKEKKPDKHGKEKETEPSDFIIYIGGKKLGRVLTIICIGCMLFPVLLVLVYISIKGIQVYTEVKYKTVIASETTKEDDIQNIKRLLDVNEQYYNQPGTHPVVKKLKNYNMHIDKFSFVNLGSYNSKNGMCLGFSLYEKLNYMNQLSEFNPKISSVYDNIDISELKKYDISNLKYVNDKTSNINAEVLYNLGIEYYSEQYQDFFVEDVNKETAEVLNIVNYFQKEGNNNKKEYPFINIKPTRYEDYYQVKIFKAKKNNGVDQFDPNFITNKIDADEPIIIGLQSNSIGGHALMGYGYEKIGEDIFKLYVSDSNIVFKDAAKYSQDKLKEIERYNYDVENNVYVLFVRGQEEGKWNYIYNPKINNTYVYQGKWNSFIPGTYMTIYK